MPQRTGRKYTTNNTSNVRISFVPISYSTIVGNSTAQDGGNNRIYGLSRTDPANRNITSEKNTVTELSNGI